MPEREYRIIEDKDMGYAVMRKGRLFWQQVSKWYTKRGWAEKKLEQLKEAGRCTETKTQ